MQVAFLGLGLIGGSLARALQREAPATGIVAWTPGGAGPKQAQADGVVTHARPTMVDAIRDVDLVVIAAPPLAALDLLHDLAGPLRSAMRPDATVTDVVSTKGRLIAIADAEDLPFVGGHPMAGRETSGYGAADPNLFQGRPWVIVPGRAARSMDIERVEWLASTAGGAPIRMTADEHDRAVAAISHLPLALSAALVEAVAGGADRPAGGDWPAARSLAASGWRDMTRLARGDVEMGAGIAATNAEALAARLRDVRAVIDGWIHDLDAGGGGSPDGTAIATRLRNARDRLETRE